MPFSPHLNMEYATPLDAAYAGLWGGMYNDWILAIEAELATKTINQNFADKLLSRPVIKDYGEKRYAHGNVSGAVTVDLENGNHQSMTLTGNVTLTITNPTASEFCALFLYITQDGTGGRTVTFPASCKNTSGTTFSISGTTASKMTDVYAKTLDSGVTWRVVQGETWT